MTTESRPQASQPESGFEPTTDLVREALGQAREVVRLEIALARADLTTELAAGKTTATALGAAAVATLMALNLLLVALALAAPVPWLGAVLVGALLLAVAAALGAVGWRARPTRILEKTRNRIETD